MESKSNLESKDYKKNKNFNLNLAVKRTLTITTEIIFEYPKVRCHPLDIAKLKNISVLKVNFIFITIKQKFVNIVQNSKFQKFNGFDENSKFKKITFK